MKIMIVNPNSSETMTAKIDQSAKKYVNGDYEVRTLATPGAPEYIDTCMDAAQALPGMMELVRKYRMETDAFIVACHCDPNLGVLREMTDKPVLGIGEASMKMAAMMGSRFSVVTLSRSSIPEKMALIRAYGLDSSLASVRFPADGSSNRSVRDRFMEASRAAVREDQAEVVVLSYAGMYEEAEAMSEELGVPVLDGVICALILASGMVKANYRPGRRRGRDFKQEDAGNGI